MQTPNSIIVEIEALQRRVQELERERDDARAKAIRECAAIADKVANCGENTSNMQQMGRQLAQAIRSIDQSQPKQGRSVWEEMGWSESYSDYRSAQ